jgi:hypothetical protein
MIDHQALLSLVPQQLKKLEPADPFAYRVTMEEPSPRSSRLAIAAALATVIAVGGAGFLLGRGTSVPPKPAPPPAAAAPTPTASAEPIFKGVLGRDDIIALAAGAADAAAAGRPPSPDIAQANGSRFELRLPFGCAGPAAEGSDAAMRWRYDAKSQTLRIHVAPVVWTAADWWAADAAPDVEGLEGFWIARPWTSSEACPGVADTPVSEGAMPAQQDRTLALGQVFFPETARGGRRNGAAYETAIRVPEAEFDPSQGFRLVVTGRVASNRLMGPVLCRQPTGPDQRPICLVSAVIDEVGIENGATGERLATWSLGGRNTPPA